MKERGREQRRKGRETGRGRQFRSDSISIMRGQGGTNQEDKWLNGQRCGWTGATKMLNVRRSKGKDGRMRQTKGGTEGGREGESNENR